MAISTGQIAVTDVRVLVIGPDKDGAHVHIYNSGVEQVFIGDETVTASSGYHLAEAKSIELNVGPNEPVYAIMAADETGSISFIATMNE